MWKSKITVASLIAVVIITVFVVIYFSRCKCEKEGYSTELNYLEQDAVTSDNIESADYYNQSEPYVKNDYSKNTSIDFMTYKNNKEPIWSKSFKWC